jgi:hypothetical protein
LKQKAVCSAGNPRRHLVSEHLGSEEVDNPPTPGWDSKGKLITWIVENAPFVPYIAFGLDSTDAIDKQWFRRTILRMFLISGSSGKRVV